MSVGVPTRLWLRVLAPGGRKAGLMQHLARSVGRRLSDGAAADPLKGIQKYVGALSGCCSEYVCVAGVLLY